ncbi:conserved membrane protein of unknown function [Candidatus Nitrosocaldus cavascurensis]|uniref:Uncharacterized protein n=2 Tax=Candidatus Nitrosocaldaceae TaxID=1968910 RepID=A0A2K5AS32_9ARCH|nr:conserved membrane protein of unknown function [Candidatus Nitrosocaldus cavascurensis]
MICRGMSKGSEVYRMRIKIVATLVPLLVLTTSLILYANALGLKNNHASDLVLIVTSGVACFYAIIIVLRQRFDGIHGISYATFASGLLLWFAAEFSWGYYEIVLGEDIPSMGIADMLWLAGYGPFMYYVLRLYRFYCRQMEKRTIAIIGILIGMLGIFMLNSLLNGLSIDDIDAATTVAVTYILLDLFLLEFILAILWTLWNGELASVTFFFLTSSLLIGTVGDMIYGYAIIHGDEVWYADIFFSADYICIIGALFWHNRFFVFSKDRMIREWQKENT